MTAPLSAVVARLRAAGCVAAEEEARELVAAASDAATLDAWVARREQGEPLAWIIGTSRFCGRPLHLAPGVYVPRIQTEELARRARQHLPPGGSALDLCTGSGAVAAHLRAEDPTATVVGLDVDRRAAACARRNGVPAVVADLAGPLRPGTGFDVITAVAPYVPTDAIRLLPTDVRDHEPRRALDGGDDGLTLVRRIIGAAVELLSAGGWLLVEVGGDQDRALAADLDGFDEVTPWHDEEGDLRGIAARWPGAAVRG